MIAPWNDHLRAYPISEWEVIEDKLLDQGKEQPGLTNFIRLVFSGVTACTLDKQGRVLLSAPLRGEVRIGKDVYAHWNA